MMMKTWNDIIATFDSETGYKNRHLTKTVIKATSSRRDIKANDHTSDDSKVHSSADSDLIITSAGVSPKGEDLALHFRYHLISRLVLDCSLVIVP